jgi:two-component system cell cycle response regulator CtrA
LSEFETNHAVPIQTIVPPSQGHPEETIRTGKLAVNLDARVVSVDDQPMHVTSREYAILELLSQRRVPSSLRKCFLTASIAE